MAEDLTKLRAAHAAARIVSLRLAKKWPNTDCEVTVRVKRYNISEVIRRRMILKIVVFENGQSDPDSTDIRKMMSKLLKTQEISIDDFEISSYVSTWKLKYD